MARYESHHARYAECGQAPRPAFAQSYGAARPLLLRGCGAPGGEERKAGTHRQDACATTGESFFTKRTQFFQKTIRLQLAVNANVAEIVLRKSVGFLYTKRTQFLGKLKAKSEKRASLPTFLETFTEFCLSIS
jgi:hypothetical protein